jgi:hypothetical protein
MAATGGQCLQIRRVRVSLNNAIRMPLKCGAKRLA